MTDVLATITNSELSAMLDCPKKWDFRYRQRLVSRKPKGKLDLGSAMHDAIELFYTKPGMEVTALQSVSLANLERMFKKHIDGGGFPYDEEEQDDMRDMLNSMIERYVIYGRANDDFEVVSLEEEFNIPARNPYTGQVHEELRVMGKTDGWCRVRAADLILEHKTAASSPSGDYWWPYLNQIDFYSYAMGRKHNVRFRGAFLNFIIKKIPTVPKELKKGGLSTAANIVTTPEIYLGEIERLGLDPEDYKDILSTLQQRNHPFVARKAVYRHDSDIEYIEQSIWAALQRKLALNRAVEAGNNPFFFKNKSDQCGWKCSYKELCIDDLPEMRESLYKVRSSEHAELTGGKNGVKV